MLPDAAAAFTVPLAAMSVMLYVDWRLALASLVALPLAVFAQLSMLNDESREAYARYHDVTEATKRAVHNYLRGIHVIKAFDLDAASFRELARAVQRMTDYVDDYAHRSAPPFIVAMKLFSGGTNALFVVPVGLWLHSRGSLDTATFIFFLIASTQVLSPFLRIANAMGQIQLLLRGADNVQSILNETALENGERSIPSDHSIRFHQLRFAYDTKDVLDGLTFEAKSGQTTAIVGPSGSGKTTALRMIPRFWDPRQGRVEVGGVDVRELDLDDWLAQIAVVFQDIFLFAGTVSENLRLARPNATDQELVAACRAARIHDAIEALPEGYATVLGERGARLSGGEKQRLSLARAFLKNAPILLLDEATAYADPQSEAEIQAAVDELSRGKTVLIVAHRLSTIRNADHIVVLDRGRVAAAGTHDELHAREGRYQELWHAFEQSLDWRMRAEEATS